MAARKLLIIDDDKIVRQNVAAYLEDSGYLVLEASNGAEGLAIFHSENPEIVLCDLMMPDMSGLDVLKEVHEACPEVPVIVISGVGVMDDVVEALRLGASDYLIKPVADMEVLEHAVRQGLEHCDLLAENRRYREELEQKNAELSRNLQIIERDQKAGRQVQERLLPPSPLKRAGYKISRYIHPSLYLSGDCIDYAFIYDRYFGFYLTDVSGHGASSAFVTIWLKYLVRHLMRDKTIFVDKGRENVFDRGPNLLLQGINRELIASRLNNHLTSFQGTIDSKTHRMSYAVGGHLPMPILVTDEGARYLEGRGKPLGIFSDVEWDVYELELPEKFTLVICSDGVLELLEADSLQEREALLLEKLSKIGGNMSFEAICESLGLGETSEPPDDIAILMVTRGH
ncbi:response regulator [Gilvimarinus sp. F26214L]|uniref:response regulator n=1 Tax=Gilvimarinus sp. DZF01 TaxID=3461371 RepID=UPI0040460D5E